MRDTPQSTDNCITVDVFFGRETKAKVLGRLGPWIAALKRAKLGGVTVANGINVPIGFAVVNDLKAQWEISLHGGGAAGSVHDFCNKCSCRSSQRGEGQPGGCRLCLKAWPLAVGPDAFLGVLPIKFGTDVAVGIPAH